MMPRAFVSDRSPQPNHASLHAPDSEHPAHRTQQGFLAAVEDVLAQLFATRVAASSAEDEQPIAEEPAAMTMGDGEVLERGMLCSVAFQQFRENEKALHLQDIDRCFGNVDESLQQCAIPSAFEWLERACAVIRNAALSGDEARRMKERITHAVKRIHEQQNQNLASEWCGSAGTLASLSRETANISTHRVPAVGPLVRAKASVSTSDASDSPHSIYESSTADELVAQQACQGSGAQMSLASGSRAKSLSDFDSRSVTDNVTKSKCNDPAFIHGSGRKETSEELLMLLQERQKSLQRVQSRLDTLVHFTGCSIVTSGQQEQLEIKSPGKDLSQGKTADSLSRYVLPAEPIRSSEDCDGGTSEGIVLANRLQDEEQTNEDHKEVKDDVAVEPESRQDKNLGGPAESHQTLHVEDREDDRKDNGAEEWMSEQFLAARTIENQSLVEGEVATSTGAAIPAATLVVVKDQEENVCREEQRIAAGVAAEAIEAEFEEVKCKLREAMQRDDRNALFVWNAQLALLEKKLQDLESQVQEDKSAVTFSNGWAPFIRNEEGSRRAFDTIAMSPIHVFPASADINVVSPLMRPKPCASLPEGDEEDDVRDAHNQNSDNPATPEYDLNVGIAAGTSSCGAVPDYQFAM